MQVRLRLEGPLLYAAFRIRKRIFSHRWSYTRLRLSVVASVAALRKARATSGGRLKCARHLLYITINRNAWYLFKAF